LRILVRTSRWAIWARRAARLTLPVLIIAVILHRIGYIASPAFLAVAATGLLIALFAFIAGGIALVRIWISGDRGWGPALFSLGVGTLVLAPVVYTTLEGARFPAVHDVSTSFSNPPPILGTNELGLAIGFDDPEMRAEMRAAFPGAVTRTYDVEVTDLFEVVANLIAARKWAPRTRSRPVDDLASGRINVVATTIVGWRDEIAITLRPVAGGTALDMRSASYFGDHDLGKNGRRIEKFLADLDEIIMSTPLPIHAGEEN
jgi:uncharacterized protein DUF1499